MPRLLVLRLPATIAVVPTSLIPTPVRVVFIPPLLMVGGWRGLAGEISGEGWQVAAGGQRCLRSDRGAGAAATGAHQVCAGSGPDTRFVGRDGRLPNLGVQARALTRTLGSAQRPFLWPKYCTLTDFSAIWHHDTMIVAWGHVMYDLVCVSCMTLFVCAVCGSATVFLALDCSYRLCPCATSRICRAAGITFVYGECLFFLASSLKLVMVANLVHVVQG